MSDKDDRYQYQPWYVKLWRKRHILPVPFRALRWWMKALQKPLYDENGYRRDTFYICYSIERGMADYNMKHYYTLEEVQQDFKVRMDDLVGESEVDLEEDLLPENE